MKRTLIVLLLAGSLTTSLTAIAQTQPTTKDPIKLEHKIKQPGQEIIKIVKPKTTNDPANPAPKPTSRGGVSNTSCYIYIENCTGFNIDAYVDGYFVGMIAGWSTGGIYAEPLSTIYLEAPNTDHYWEPIKVDCENTKISLDCWVWGN
jgi:hypothetical protein